MATSGTLTLDPATTKASQDRLDALRDQWVADATALVDQVAAWAASAADERGWRIERSDVTLAEEAVGGAYTVPKLTILAGEDELQLEPIARGVLGSEGRYDLTAWPNLFRVSLLHKNGEWVILTKSGLYWPNPWSRETFLHIAEGLMSTE